MFKEDWIQKYYKKVYTGKSLDGTLAEFTFKDGTKQTVLQYSKNGKDYIKEIEL